MRHLFQQIFHCPKCFQLISKATFFGKNLYLADGFYLVDVYETQSRTVACKDCLERFLKNVPHEEVCFPERTIITFKPGFTERVQNLICQCRHFITSLKTRKAKL